MTELQDIATAMHKMAVTGLNGWLANANREAPCFIFFLSVPRPGTLTKLFNIRPPQSLKQYWETRILDFGLIPRTAFKK